MGVGRLRIWATGTCSADLKGEVNQGPIFLDKCRYALLNERLVKYRLSEHFFFLRRHEENWNMVSKEKSLTVFLQSFSLWSFNYSTSCCLMLKVSNPITRECDCLSAEHQLSMEVLIHLRVPATWILSRSTFCLGDAFVVMHIWHRVSLPWLLRHCHYQYRSQPVGNNVFRNKRAHYLHSNF